jgi:hypothetical protein
MNYNNIVKPRDFIEKNEWLEFDSRAFEDKKNRTQRTNFAIEFIIF